MLIAAVQVLLDPSFSSHWSTSFSCYLAHHSKLKVLHLTLLAKARPKGRKGGGVSTELNFLKGITHDAQ